MRSGAGGKSERELLLGKKMDEGVGDRRSGGGRGQDEAAGSGLVGDSSDLTEGLSGLVRRMDGQVRQSELTLSALLGSSQTLGETETEFKEMSDNIKRGGKLLSKYGRREITDKLLILLAVLFYAATCLYIVKKRFLGHFL